jgi:hypothetical protein
LINKEPGHKNGWWVFPGESWEMPIYASATRPRPLRWCLAEPTDSLAANG